MGGFSNIELYSDTSPNTPIEGTYTISNGYRTVEFVTFDECGEDPCGDPIYCLPGNDLFAMTVYTDTIDEAPAVAGFPYAGVVDVCGNTLDGGINNANMSPTPEAAEAANMNGVGDDPPADNYRWSFRTTGQINDIVPSIHTMSLGVGEDNVAIDADLTITWLEDTEGDGVPGPGVTMMSSTLNNSNISLTPIAYDPADLDPNDGIDTLTHEMSYWITNDPLYPTYASQPQVEGDPVNATLSEIRHGLFGESVDGLNWYYYPSIGEGVKSSYQICFFPAVGPDADSPTYEPGDPDTDCDVNNNNDSCCSGTAAASCTIPYPVSYTHLTLPTN